MKKFLALLLTIAMVSSLLCGMAVFADDVTDGETEGETNLLADGTYQVPVTVTGDNCEDLEGNIINPWASENTYLEYTVTAGVIDNQCYLYNDYYRVGYWPTRNEVRGAKSFDYHNTSYNGMDVVIPSGVGAVTLAKGYDQEVSYNAVFPVSFTGHGVSGTNYTQTNNNNSIFNARTTYKKVIVSEGITTIGYGAFSKIRPSAITVVLPSTLTSVGQYFLGGSGSGVNIASITIIGKLPSLPSNCFNGLAKVKTLDMSGVYGLSSVPAGVITGCSALETLIINTDTDLSIGATSGSSSALPASLKNVTITTPGALSLNVRAFYTNTNLETLNINAASLNITKDTAFSGCTTNARVNYSADMPVTGLEYLTDYATGYRLCPTGADYADVFEFTDGAEPGTYSVACYATKADTTSTVKPMLAIYDEEGNLMAVKTVALDLAEVVLTLEKAPTKAKLIMVDSLTNLKPIITNAELIYTPAPVVEDPAA